MHARTLPQALLIFVIPCALKAQESHTLAARLATKEEYAACLKEDDAIERTRSALERQAEELRAYTAKFLAADAKLAEQVRRHAPTTKAEIESYNRAVQTRNRAAQDFNERGQALQRVQSKLNSYIFEVNGRCGSLMVSEEVKAAVERELRDGAPRQ